MAAPESSLRLRQYWRYGRGTALHYLYVQENHERREGAMLGFVLAELQGIHKTLREILKELKARN